MTTEPRKPAKSFIAQRVSPNGVALIDRRAAAETGGNRSEMVRRMLAYAATRMPVGWEPQ